MKNFFVFLFCLSFSLSLTARQRSSMELFSIAHSALNLTSSIKRAPLEDADSDSLRMLHRTEELAVIGYPEVGFAIVSTDEGNEPLLGYSLSEWRGIDNLPDGLYWWLEAVNAQLIRHNTAVKQQEYTRHHLPASSVEPLIQTQWGQREPYNHLIKYEKNGTTYQFVTGCVATSMAQVIKYYEYPAKGFGEHSYTLTFSDIGSIVLSANFAEHTYGYANMLNEYDYYSSQYSEEQKNAVSRLMHDCGIAVDMSYNGNASGAYAKDVPNALKKYFGYDEKCKIVYRNAYNDNEWVNLVFEELDEGRPVIYSGNDNISGGHSFIIDGYNSSGFVHVNWGWNGYYDGYYNINLLNPGSDSYSKNQTATIGIQPKKNNNIIYTLTLTSNNNLFGEVSGEGSYPEGTLVRILAKPKSGYQFMNWSDGNTNPERTITIKSNLTLKAEFDEEKWCRVNLSTTSPVRGNAIGSGKYIRGTKVTVEAVAYDGYRFFGWFNSKEIKHNENFTASSISGKNPWTFTITSDTALTAFIISEPKYKCTIDINNYSMGKIVIDDVDTVSKVSKNATALHLEALPYRGYDFIKWSDGNLQQKRSVMLSSDSTIVAIFDKKRTEYNIVVRVENESGGKICGRLADTGIDYSEPCLAYKTTLYSQGSKVQIKAIPNDDYEFVEWSDGKTDSERTITLSEGDVTLYAKFEKPAITNTYTLTINANDDYMGSVFGSGDYSDGESAVITAVANEGYHFAEWSDGNTQNPRTVIVTEDKTFTAVFIADEQCGTIETTDGITVWEDQLPYTWESVSFTTAGTETKTLQASDGCDSIVTFTLHVLYRNVTLKENEAVDYYTLFAQDYNGQRVNTATLDRQFTQGKWATLCLPFNVNKAMMMSLGLYNRVFEFRYAQQSDDKTIQVFFVPAQSIEAGKGYIVNPNAKLAEKTSFVFPNVTIDTDSDNGDITALTGYNDGTNRGNLFLVGTLRTGILQGSTTGNTYLGLRENKIYYPNITTGTSIRAYRGFFRSDVPVNAQRVRIIAEGETVTGLEVMKGEEDLHEALPARKYIDNGILYIERNGITYTAQGQRLE